MRRVVVLSLVVLLGLTASAEAGFLARVKERREARRAGACQPAATQAACAPAAAPPQTFAPAVTRAAVGHTHTCANGHTWDHAATPGHTCPVCGLPQFVQDAVPRPVTVGAYRPAGVPQAPVYALPAAAGGCANGNCAVPQQTYQRGGLFRR